VGVAIWNPQLFGIKLRKNAKLCIKALQLRKKIASFLRTL